MDIDFAQGFFAGVFTMGVVTYWAVKMTLRFITKAEAKDE